MNLSRHVPASAGHRELQALDERGRADALARRPRASEHPVYGFAYGEAAVERRVRDCEAIMVVGEGQQCPACGADASGLLHRCACKSRDPVPRVAGFYVLFGVESDTRVAEFRATSWLRDLMADGTPLINAVGEDISHRASPLQ